MKVYSIFLMILMLVNFGIMAYLNLQQRIFIVFGLIVYCIFALWDFTNLDRSFLIFRGNCIFFLVLICLTLVLYKAYGFKHFGTIFFSLIWVVSSRTLGFVDSLDFEEKILDVFFITPFNITFLLWVIFLLFHQKIYQKIIFLTLSVCLAFLFYVFSMMQDGITNTILLTPYMFELFLAITFSPITYIFFYCGEILLFFLLCYQIFFKDSKNSNIQTHSPRNT